MENLTFSDVSSALAVIVGFIGSVGFLQGKLKKWIDQAFSDHLKIVKKEVSEISERLDTVDMESCKNYIVSRLSAVDRGHALSEIERERFWEQYEHYHKIGGNSYITRKVEQLKEDGKL